MNKRTLTFEQTRGTKTYHLPFGKGEQPRLTLVVRRTPSGSFHAGISVCAKEDLFTRQGGRARAFHRLNGRPIMSPDGVSLFGTLDTLCAGINDRRPNTVPEKVKWDLMEVCAFLNEAFDKLESNRAEKLMRIGDELIGASVDLTREVDIEPAPSSEDGYEAVGC